MSQREDLVNLNWLIRSHTQVTRLHQRRREDLRARGVRMHRIIRCDKLLTPELIILALYEVTEEHRQNLAHRSKEVDPRK